MKETAYSYLDGEDERLSYLARQIWENPEVALQEKFASKLLATELEKEDFSIEWGAGGMETAFVASWGAGSPIIGILGEYDALPSLSQDVAAEKRPLSDGGPGHGCGHNLFGTASFGAAVAVKNVLQNEGLPGTIRFYGCPAEETLVGKTYMARDGVFDDLDASIAWHPGSFNMVWHSSALAMNSFKVNFHGVAAHGGTPHLGRSALDGVMLMDVGVNYLREHIIQEARIHSVVTHGGMAPNVVPPYAQVWYFVRAPKRPELEDIYARMLDIAKGAALMSGTTHDIEFITGCYDVLPNSVLSNLMLENMQALGGIKFSDQEKAFAKQLQDTFPDGAVARSRSRARMLAAVSLSDEELGDALHEGVIPHKESDYVLPGSTEVGDVSYITPTVQCTTACEAIGTPGHSWQTTSASGSSIGMKGMLLAAKTMAGTALDLFTKPDALAAARAEFAEATAGQPYVTPLPEGAIPS